jgi:hypothetical protein
MNIFKPVAAGCVLLAGWLAFPVAHGQIAVKNQGYVPFSEEPINYRSENLTDPVAVLEKRLDRGEGRGRDAGCPAPPAQIRTCGIPAYGSYLG